MGVEGQGMGGRRPGGPGQQGLHQVGRSFPEEAMFYWRSEEGLEKGIPTPLWCSTPPASIQVWEG